MHPEEVIALAPEAHGAPPRKVPERRDLEAAAAPSRSVALGGGLAIGIDVALSALAPWLVWAKV